MTMLPGFPDLDKKRGDEGPVKKEIADTWKVDVNDYTFFEQNWQDFVPYDEEIKVSKPGTPNVPISSTTKTISVDPLDEADDLVRNVITSFRSWGQGAVLAAMKGLGINSVDDQDTADSVIDWLSENYGNIFEGDDDFGDVPSVDAEEYVYTPTEMDLTYEPKYSDAEKTIRHAFDGQKYNLKESYPEQEIIELSAQILATNSLYDL